MSRRIPVDDKRADWSRLVADQANRAAQKINALEATTAGLTRAKLRFLCG